MDAHNVQTSDSEIVAEGMNIRENVGDNLRQDEIGMRNTLNCWKLMQGNEGNPGEEEAYNVSRSELRRNQWRSPVRPSTKAQGMEDLSEAMRKEEATPEIQEYCEKIDQVIAARLGADKAKEVKYRQHMENTGPFKLDPPKLGHVEYENKAHIDDAYMTPYIDNSLFMRLDKNNIFKYANIIAEFSERDPMAKEDIMLLKGQRLLGLSHTELHKINSLDRWDRFLESMKQAKWNGMRGSLLLHIRTEIRPPAVRYLGEAATSDDPTKSLRYLTNWRTLLYNVLDQDKQEKYLRNMKILDVMATENPRYITGMINRLCRCADTAPGESIVMARNTIENVAQWKRSSFKYEEEFITLLEIISGKEFDDINFLEWEHDLFGKYYVKGLTNPRVKQIFRHSLFSAEAATY